MSQGAVVKLNRQKQEISSEVRLVTPDLATEMLERNTINRPVSDKVVDRYASAMKRGEWELTHQGIAFDVQGRLQDGQHRLWAVVRSETAVRMLVTTGLSDDAIKSIDTQKVRTTGDAIGILSKLGSVDLSGLGSPTIVAHMANMLVAITSGSVTKASTEQIVQAVEKYREGITAAMRELTEKKGISSAPIRAAVAFAHKTTPRQVEEFAGLFRTGANLEDQSPVLVLRNHVMTHGASSGTDRRNLSVRTLNAIAYYVKGQRIRSLYATEDAVAYFGRAHGLKLLGSGDAKDGASRFARRKVKK